MPETGNDQKAVFDQYPIVIDQLTNSIEMVVCQGGKRRPQVLHRWKPDHQLAPHVIDSNRCAHVFGDGPTHAQSTTALAYDIDGVLYALWYARRHGWNYTIVAEEISGRVVRLPSVRHVFTSQADRDRYVELASMSVDLIRVGDKPKQAQIRELLELLAKSGQPAVCVNVSQEIAKK